MMHERNAMADQAPGLATTVKTTAQCVVWWCCVVLLYRILWYTVYVRVRSNNTG